MATLDVKTIMSSEHDEIVQKIADGYCDPALARFAINDYRDRLAEFLEGEQKQS